VSKENVRHIHDEAAGGIVGLQDGVELREKLSAKLGFFGLGFCRSGASSFFRCAALAVSASQRVFVRARLADRLTRRRELFRLLPSPWRVGGGFFRLCLQALGFGFGCFRGLASLFCVGAALHFIGGILTRFGFARFGGGFCLPWPWPALLPRLFAFTEMTRASSAVCTESRAAATTDFLSRFWR